jgi:hypothetical protein
MLVFFFDKLGRQRDHFIGVVHVSDTTSFSLKKAIEALLNVTSQILKQRRK